MIPAVLHRRIEALRARLWPAARRVRRTLPPHFTHVLAASGDLSAAMKEIEERFLVVGATLETTTALSRDLVEHCEALIALALGQGGGEIIVDGTAQHIWQAIEFVEQTDARVHALVDRLKLADQEITRTLGTERNLETTLAPLKFIQTLFRVESAGLPDEVQEMFQALGRDIDSIRIRVETGFREKLQLLREIQTILRRAVTHLLAEQQRARQTVADLRSHMTASLGGMKATYEKNRDRDTRLVDVSQSVNATTSKLVMGLQFQDILNQKLQHTHSILQEMERSFAALPADRTGACRHLRYIEQSGRIAAAQLGAMHDELIDARAAIGGSLEDIIRSMETLDRDCMGLQDLDAVTTGVDGAIQILLESLADARRLVQAAETHSTEAHKLIEPIGGMTTNFTAFMRDLSLEIRLIGLNAEVQAAHVGAGTGLEVLSAQTSAISRETSHLSLSLATQLDALTSGLDECVGRFSDICSEVRAYGATIGAESASDEANLHDYRDSSLEVLHHISEQLPKLEASTRTAHQQADFATTAAARMVTLKTAIESLVAVAKTAADSTGLEVDITDLTDRFMEKYTMRSQVDIHREALGGQPVAPADTPAPAPAALGEVELFGDEPPAAPPVTAPAPDANIDLWDEPAATPDAAAADFAPAQK
jgi:hypothetical protein